MFLFYQNNLRGFSLYNPIYLMKQKDFPGQGKIEVGHDSRKRSVSDKCPVLHKDVNIFSRF